MCLDPLPGFACVASSGPTAPQRQEQMKLKYRMFFEDTYEWWDEPVPSGWKICRMAYYSERMLVGAVILSPVRMLDLASPMESSADDVLIAAYV